MFTQNLRNHTGGVWLCGATAAEQENSELFGDELMLLFNNQDNKYAELGFFDEGEYTLTLGFNRRADCEFFAGYWYMDSGSFEPQLHIIGQLYCNEAFTFIYKKLRKDRYYGSLILVAEPFSYSSDDYISSALECASLDIDFTSFPKSVCNPIVLIHGNDNSLTRHRIKNVTLRSARLPDGSLVCDELELRSGALTRFISPLIDNCLLSRSNIYDFVLPIAKCESVSPDRLPTLASFCTISSNVEIKLFPNK